MNIFQSVSSRRPKKNKFDLSHERKMSLKMTNLVPIMLQEILPGDSFKVTSEIMIRLAPMIAPVMHRVNVYTHYFFVPNRIIWNEWEDFITGGKDGTSAPVHPFIINDAAAIALMTPGSLADYFGLPEITSSVSQIQLNALPFRAYLEIYNEYYRDQNLEDEIVFSKASGGSQADIAELLKMRNRAWEKDYFTSALPWTQRGPEATIPMTPVYKDISNVYDLNGNPVAENTNLITGTNAQPTDLEINDGFGTKMRIENLEALSNTTINDLRKSVRLQEWLEKNARGGARYIEQLLSHFGRAPKDARLQRPEYLGGGKQPVVISEVLNQAGSTTIDLQPVGEMSGHGISVGSSNGFKREFDEHGFVIGIMSVLPRTAYQNGVHKMWTRGDKLEYAWPEFAQLGEQEIVQREIFFDGTTPNTGTFGYTPRYSEYKYGCSTVHGEFRTNLDFWHLGRKFAALPPLNKDFVTATPDDTKRIFAVTDPDSDDLYCQIYHNVSALRPLPYYGTPTL